jgi:hypothetical protein
MNSEVMNQIRQIIDAKAQAQPTPMEFELAYQARVAIDRIRFAIKNTEQFAPRTEQMQEAGMQLLDALERLESAERRFQHRFRTGELCITDSGIGQAQNGFSVGAGRQ